MPSSEIPFPELASSDLFIDCVYKGGADMDLRSEVLSKLLPGCSNSGGFRKVLTRDKSKVAYVVLFTTQNELEWPDYLNEETGIFRYYGDNREPGRQLTETQKKGNLLLEQVFGDLRLGRFDEIPPFLIFQKGDFGRDMVFRGLAVPGTISMKPDDELVAFWRTFDSRRFQNYEAYFTVLDTGNLPIARQWLHALREGSLIADTYAPKAWIAFKTLGRNGIRPLRAKKLIQYPKAAEQLAANAEGLQCLDAIRGFYSPREKKYDFEYCAADIVMKLDPHFTSMVLTRPWRDGGRDALAKYRIETPGHVRNWISMDCALEAKCYKPEHSVGVHEMSRLISRIRYRQFGVMVTTSYVDKQAYDEVVEDGHPILMVTASDIAAVLFQNSIHPDDVPAWLESLSGKYRRLR